VALISAWCGSGITAVITGGSGSGIRKRRYGSDFCSTATDTATAKIQR